jgi:Protein of unknown function (DUF3634)
MVDLELVGKIVFVALVAGALWLALQPRYVFVVRIDNGRVRVARGKATAAFLQRVGEVCGQAGVTRGWVGGVRREKRIALLFSRNFPPAAQQQLRNYWAMHG